MLRSIALVMTSLLSASPVIAADPAMVVAKKDGFRFEYAKELRPGDRVRIYGHDLDRKDSFSLIVEPDGYVHGKFGNVPVRFSVPRKERDKLFASVKAAEPVDIAQSEAPLSAAARP